MHLRRLAILLALAVGALGVAAAPASAQSKVCIFVQERNVTAGAYTGHAFVQLLPDSGEHAGKRDLIYGFYPKHAWRAVIGGPGNVLDDKTHGWDWRKCGNVNHDQYSVTQRAIAADISSPPDYALLKFNCTDWVFKMAEKAGIPLPSAKALGTGLYDPEVLAKNLQKDWEQQGRRNLPNTIGTVWHNNSVQKPLDAPDYKVVANGARATATRMSPESYTDVSALAFSDPGQLADGLGMTAETDRLPDEQVGVGNRLRIRFAQVDTDRAVTVVRWGDGSDTEQDASADLEYRKAGDYRVRGIAIVGATVYRFELTVQVSEPGGDAERTIEVPHNAPRPETVPAPDPPTVPAPLADASG
jgi:hypothetical protein